MRKQLIDFLKKELTGPDPIPPFVQENGEEILNEPPRLRYSAGILFPQSSGIEDVDKNDEQEQDLLSNQLELEEEVFSGSDSGRESRSGGDYNDAHDSTDEMLNLANLFLPSAMGFSCFLNIPENGFNIRVSAGRYSTIEFSCTDKNGNIFPRQGYFREAIKESVNISRQELPTKDKRSCEFPVLKNSKATNLVIDIRNRTSKSQWGGSNQLFTFSLINKAVSSSSRIDNANCFFQVEFSVGASDGSACFLPYPEKKSTSADEDEQSNSLSKYA